MGLRGVARICRYGDPSDLVYSCGSIHYVARDRPCGALFARLQGLTRAGRGLHAHVVFTERRIYREKNEVVHCSTRG